MRHLNGLDTFVNALGVKSNDILAAPLKAKGIQVDIIGDALSPGKILDAVAEGARAAREIYGKMEAKNKANKNT
jgi:hypothetical protein